MSDVLVEAAGLEKTYPPFALSAAGIGALTAMPEMHHQLVMLPMFLFASTFYPLSLYPAAVRPVVVALPLHQSIELMRGLTTGRLGPGMLAAAAYLPGMGALGTRLATRRLGRMSRS